MRLTVLFILCSFQIFTKTLSKYADKSSLRVVNGRDAVQGELPYVVRLEVHLKLEGHESDEELYTFIAHECSGSALTSTWVLTADHCLDEIQEIPSVITARYKIRYGSPHIKPSENKNLVLALKLIRPVRPYNHFMTDDDIALIYTEKMTMETFGKLHAVHYTSLVGETVSLMGFGIMQHQDANGFYSKDTFQLDKPLQIVDKALVASCERQFRHIIMKLCIMPRCGQTESILPGDSGGPVVHSSGAIIGVNSKISDMNQQMSPRSSKYAVTPTVVLITPVSPYVDWIYTQVHKEVQ